MSGRTEKKAGTDRQSGFTLIEVLVALVVLSLVLGATYQLFSTGLHSVSQTDQQIRATMVAESVMAAVGTRVTADADQLSDVTEDGFRWVVNVVPFEDPNAPPPERVKLRLYRVSVVVRWGMARSYTLSTLALGPLS